MNPWVALALVIVATVASDMLILRLYHRKRQRQMRRGPLLVITKWFFLSFGLMAFQVIPKLRRQHTRGHPSGRRPGGCSLGCLPWGGGQPCRERLVNAGAGAVPEVRQRSVNETPRTIEIVTEHGEDPAEPFKIWRYDAPSGQPHGGPS